MRRRPATARLLATLLALAVVAAACGDDSSGEDVTDTDVTSTTSAPPDEPEPESEPEPEPEPDPEPDAEPQAPMIGEPISTPNPTVSDPPDVGSTFYQGIGFDLSLVGYEQQEYFFNGTARSFQPVADLTPDGRWATEVGPDEADYTSRMLVIRPSDPADFNGTVFMEWFNVSGGLDAAPNLTMSHVQQFREGAVYVGVSAQFRGIEQAPGTIDIGFPIFLKGIQPERYASLSHPGDSFSYDIFNQAAQAVRSPEGIDPLDGLGVEQIIATGESQSAFRLTTYVNGVDPIVQLFDGFMIHSRGGGSADLRQTPEDPAPTPAQVLIREDVRVPVMTFQTDTDLLLLGWVPDRQPDGDNIALWEVAGTAHGDLYSIALDRGPQDVGDSPDIAEVIEVSSPIPGIMDCSAPINAGPQHYVMNAAIHALIRWTAGGERPPTAPLAEVAEVEGDPDATDREATHEPITDEFGNILGGVRTAWVDVPIATLTGFPPEGDTFCGLFGTTALFDEATLAELYPDKQTYVDLVRASLEQSVADGFLMQADADLILQHAEENDIAR
ncbi:MAG: alpha/beta hydrolase domain-containing protein [Actinomycetota bacterium]